MPVNFPNSPSLNEQYTYGDNTWQWNGQAWDNISVTFGPQGATGTQGLQGLQGPQGTQGLQGVQGTQGTQGLQGLQGLQGTQGLQGLQGPQGTQGIQGLQGLQGPQGTQGIQGFQGRYTISNTVPNSPNSGDAWLNSTNNRLYIYDGVEWFEPGGNLQGIQGTQGVQGTQGTTGAQGLQGVIGTQGIQGLQGIDGLYAGQGTQGIQGIQGLQGLQGIQGSSPTTLTGFAETSNIVGSGATGTINFYVSSGSVWYYTVNATANFTINVAASATTTLNSYLSTNQSITIALLVTNGTTAYYPTTFQIDGSTITPKWLGAAPPTSGNISSIDLYSYTILKTAPATYTVVASQTRFA